jgi:hypothetical protein
VNGNLLETGRVSYNGVTSLPPRARRERPDPEPEDTIPPQRAYMRPGLGGWMLSEYDWDPQTGIAKLTYERPQGDTGTELRTEVKTQPYHPKHAGWPRRPRRRR